jgi:hypothetical protein
LAGIFQQKKQYSRPVIEDLAGELRISVSPPGSMIDEWIAGAVFLGMISGAVFGLWPLNPVRLLAALVFAGAAFLIFRGIYEQNAAEQIVIVSGGTAAFIRRTRLWTRRSNVQASEISEVSSGSSFGTGRVSFTVKGRKVTVLGNLLPEDASRCAREIRAVLKRD